MKIVFSLLVGEFRLFVLNRLEETLLATTLRHYFQRGLCILSYGRKPKGGHSFRERKGYKEGTRSYIRIHPRW